MGPLSDGGLLPMGLLEWDPSDGWTPSDGTPPMDPMPMGPSLMGTPLQYPLWSHPKFSQL